MRINPVAQQNRETGRSRGRISPPVLAGLALVILVLVVVAVYLFYPEPEPEPVPPPMPAPGAAAEAPAPLETVEPARTAAERGDSAREIINRLQEAPGEPDYAEAHARAEELQSEGRLSDAQLLYFFAARGGHAPAAYQLATMYDPNHHAPETSLVDEPDPFQAYKWYVAARDAGHDQAGQRLSELRAWAEQAGGEGNADAERLLLQWEQDQ